METHDNDVRYKELLASVPDPFAGEEDLDTLLEQFNSYHYCFVDRESTSCMPSESLQEIETYIDKALAKLESYADETTYVPDGDIPFVAPHGCLDIINQISKANAKSGGEHANVFLHEKPRKWMKTLVGQMMALDKQHKLDFKEFTSGLNNSADIDGVAVAIPLEVLWWLHDKGFLLLTSYINDNLNDTSKLAELKDDLLALVCCFDSIEVRQSETHDDNPNGVPVVRRMVRDLLGCLLATSERTILKCSKACSIILDSIMKKAMTRLTVGDSAPPGNYVSVLRVHTLTSVEDLQAFCADILHRFLTVSPRQSPASAITGHAEWLYDKMSAHVTDFLRDVLEVLRIPHVLKILEADLYKAEVNWKHLLVTVSTFVICVEGARKHVKALVSALVEDALYTKNKEAMTAAFLIMRHCCLEVKASFPSYATWFSVAFSANTTVLSFSFLVEFLRELVPLEPGYCLRAHVATPPSAPRGQRHLLAEYVALARTRLVDLDSTASLLGNDSLDQDVEVIVRHFRDTGEVYPSLVNVATLFRGAFQRELVPRLIAGGHGTLLSKLVETGRLSQQTLDTLYRANPKVPGLAASAPPPSKEDETRLLLAGAAERLKVTCNLQGSNLDKAVASLAEKLPLKDREQLEFAREFGCKYLALAEERPNLPRPPSLVKKTAFACSRLLCWDGNRDSISTPDTRAEPSFTEWLDYESGMTEEFLRPPDQRLYLRTVKTRYHMDYREMFSSLVDKLLDVPQRRPCLEATVACLVAQILPGIEGHRDVPVLLDKWSKLSYNHSHQTFLSIAQLLPEWLLFTDSLADEPTQETVQSIAQLINVDLLDTLSHEGVLRRQFTQYVMMGLDHIRSTFGPGKTHELLDSLLDSCSPFHLSLLAHFEVVRCLLDPLVSKVPTSLLGKAWALMEAVTSWPDSPGDSLKDSWETAAVLWYHRLHRDGCLEAAEMRLAGTHPTVRRWLFLLRAIRLGHLLEGGVASFSLAGATPRLRFTCDCETLLGALEQHMQSYGGVATALLGSDAPCDLFSPATMRLAGLAGLLLLVDRRRAWLASTPQVVQTLAAALFASLERGTAPGFFSAPGPDVGRLRERRDLLDHIKSACQEMARDPAPVSTDDCIEITDDEMVGVAEGGTSIYFIDDDDFEIPDDFP